MYFVSATGFADAALAADHLQDDFGLKFTAVISLLVCHDDCPLWTLDYSLAAVLNLGVTTYFYLLQCEAEPESQ